jgi:pSer/pThr/pTyr-binding forkhead associated (FHA) protein
MDDINSSPPETSEQPEENIPPYTFLIMEGVRAIPLDKVRITIGRSLDNLLVVDDPRVSRRHAEIRVIRGGFVLFDLKSSGGTYLNGRRIEQGILYPGDLISLAGVKFVFTQDTRFTGQGTNPLSPGGPGKRQTVIFNSSIKSNKSK